jgi:hypothetical protein
MKRLVLSLVALGFAVGTTTAANAAEPQGAELYPDDRAVGFHEGDFRGVFWVEYPVEP